MEDIINVKNNTFKCQHKSNKNTSETPWINFKNLGRMENDSSQSPKTRTIAFCFAFHAFL